MTLRDTFVAERQARWDRMERLLGTGPRGAPQWSALASGYRALCADLARAQTLGLPPDVVSYLDDLAGRAHNRLYAGGPGRGGSVLQLVFAEFPREVRRSWPFFAAACLLFYGPFTLGGIGAFLDPGFATAILPEEMLAQMEEMYSSEIGRAGAAEDAGMAGFYVWNNVGIALRCFVTGIFAGLGSLFFLVYNGLVLGVVEGYLWAAGRGLNLLTFTAGHTAWELMGIVVSGAAGLRLGWALVVTEGRTRIGSLRHAAPAVYRLVVGAAAMLLVAAAIEAFWSASPVPAPVKWAFGAAQVVIVLVWLAFGGRRP